MKTIETLDSNYDKTIGHLIDISYLDIKTINRAYCSGKHEWFYIFIFNYYYCKDKCRDSRIRCERGGYINPKTCDTCICPDGFTGKFCTELDNPCKK